MSSSLKPKKNPPNIGASKEGQPSTTFSVSSDVLKTSLKEFLFDKGIDISDVIDIRNYTNSELNHFVAFIDKMHRLVGEAFRQFNVETGLPNISCAIPIKFSDTYLDDEKKTILTDASVCILLERVVQAHIYQMSKHFMMQERIIYWFNDSRSVLTLEMVEHTGKLTDNIKNFINNEFGKVSSYGPNYQEWFSTTLQTVVTQLSLFLGDHYSVSGTLSVFPKVKLAQNNNCEATICIWTLIGPLRRKYEINIGGINQGEEKS